MKILFAHDHIFMKFKKNIYTKGGLREEVLNEYLDLGKELIIISRVENLNADLKKSKNNLIKNKNINFLFLPSISNIKNLLFKNRVIEEQIENQVRESELIFVRLPSEIGKLTYKIAKKLNKKIIVEVVASAKDSLWHIGKISAKLYSFLAEYEMKKIIKKSENVKYVSTYLEKRYPTNGEKIICSDVQLSEKMIKEKSRIKEEIEIIGIIASLDSRIKGLNIIFKAIKILKIKGLNVKLEIVGSGDTKYWESLIKKFDLTTNIVFKGILTKEEIIDWLDEIDLYLQPSYTEGLSRATLEAMSRKLPVIATNVGGFLEIINSYFLITKGSFKELADKIEELNFNNKLKMEQAELNYETSKKYKLSILKTKKNFFYKKIIKEIKC